MENKVIYYEDELNDEFSDAKITPIVIDESYKYKRGFFWNKISLIFQNFFSMPVKIIYSKVKFNIKFIGKEKLKSCKDTGYFLYGNHTQIFGDTLIPSLAIYPKRNFFIVNPENISMKGSGWLIKLLGAVPVPGTKVATKNFLDYIEYLQERKYCVTIYPEAHIWPYYTKIRPFKSVSFKYPVKLNKPVYCFVNTYHKKGKNKVKIVTYIDGPFYPKNNLPLKEAQEELRNRVYNVMCDISSKSDFDLINYVKKK